MINLHYKVLIFYCFSYIKVRLIKDNKTKQNETLYFENIKKNNKQSTSETQQYINSPTNSELWSQPSGPHIPSRGNSKCQRSKYFIFCLLI